MRNRVFIIAEAGVNHNGDPDLAREMVIAAARAGADAVKFQTFKADALVTPDTPLAGYQQASTGSSGSQFEMLKKLELTNQAHHELLKDCARIKIEFMSTPFDLVSAQLLMDLGLKRFKVGSGDLTNLPLLKKLGGFKKEVILSTGMGNLEEIRAALRILNRAGTPDKQIVVLHANTEYPSPFEDVNLKAMVTIGQEFNIRTGYSDHTPGIEVPVAAVAMGACVIEKHFTLDRSMEGPDHRASLLPDELHAMVEAIRHIEAALGHGTKEPSPSEMKNMAVARKSLVAACEIQEGEPFTENNLCVKRPGTGISPLHWEEIIGTPATKNYKKNDLI